MVAVRWLWRRVNQVFGASPASVEVVDWMRSDRGPLPREVHLSCTLREFFVPCGEQVNCCYWIPWSLVLEIWKLVQQSYLAVAVTVAFAALV